MQRKSWCDGFLPKAASKPAVRTQPTILAVSHVSSMHSAPGWCLGRPAVARGYLCCDAPPAVSFGTRTSSVIRPWRHQCQPQGMELTKEFLESPLRGTIEHGVTLHANALLVEPLEVTDYTFAAPLLATPG